jgi:LysM repeat protein
MHDKANKPRLCILRGGSPLFRSCFKSELDFVDICHVKSPNVNMSPFREIKLIHVVQGDAINDALQNHQHVKHRMRRMKRSKESKHMNKLTTAALTIAGVATFAMATEVSADASTYKVQSGDTLSEIALANNTTVDALTALNNLADANLIVVDEQLELGDGVVLSSTASVTSTAATEVVASSSVASVATSTTPAGSGSVYDQFIAAGGTDALWQYIVIPESGGNPDASNGMYHGLGQTNQSWGYGSVAEQTAGMLAYAVNRYESIDNAIAFKQVHGWW